MVEQAKSYQPAERIYVSLAGDVKTAVIVRADAKHPQPQHERRRATGEAQTSSQTAGR